MPSDTALNFVNKALRMTGDYEPVATVIGTPAAIADRIIDSLNLVLVDVCKKIEFPELAQSFTVTANGTDSIYLTSGYKTRPRSGLTISVSTYPLEEVSPQKLHELREQQQATGTPKFFARVAGSTGELGIDIYPIPASGAQITLLAAQEPTLFTLNDTATTEIQADDLLLLGALAHMDSYSGMERGYMQLYEAAKNRTWKDTYEHQAYRIQPESYI